MSELVKHSKIVFEYNGESSAHYFFTDETKGELFVTDIPFESDNFLIPKPLNEIAKTEIGTDQTAELKNVIAIPTNSMITTRKFLQFYVPQIDRNVTVIYFETVYPNGYVNKQFIMDIKEMY